MLCLKTSSGLVRKREPSGAEGLPAVLFNLGDNLQTALANVATDELRSVCIYLQKKKNKDRAELHNVFNCINSKIRQRVPVCSV